MKKYPQYLFPSSLSPHPDLPSVEFDKSSAEWENFIDNIEDNGITEPILFVEGEEHRWLIVDGVRRWLAATQLKLTDLPAIRLSQEKAAEILIEKGDAEKS